MNVPWNRTSLYVCSLTWIRCVELENIIIESNVFVDFDVVVFVVNVVKFELAYVYTYILVSFSAATTPATHGPVSSLLLAQTRCLHNFK